PAARTAAVVALRRRRSRPRLRRLAGVGALPGVAAGRLTRPAPAQLSPGRSWSSVSGAGGWGIDTAPGGGAAGSGPVDGGRFGSDTAPSGKSLDPPGGRAGGVAGRAGRAGAVSGGANREAPSGLWLGRLAGGALAGDGSGAGRGAGAAGAALAG